MSLAPVKMQPGGKQHFADNSYDVILSDLRMPGMTGEDLYRRIVNGRILRVASRRVAFVTASSPSDVFSGPAWRSTYPPPHEAVHV